MLLFPDNIYPIGIARHEHTTPTIGTLVKGTGTRLGYILKEGATPIGCQG